MKRILPVVTLFAFAGSLYAAGLTGRLPSPLLVSGSGRVYLLAPDGHIAWEQKNCGNIHRAMVRGGFIYYSNADLRRVDPGTGKDEIVYRPSPKEGVYGFDLAGGDRYVVAENGTDFIAELNSSFKPVVRFKGDPYNADLGRKPDPHHHYRMIRKTSKGTYLVGCSSQNVVKEYDVKGKLVWEQKLPNLAFEALRRLNGNTIVAHLDAITEYSPDHQVVWQFKCSDAPELKLANLCGIQELPNGNLVVGTYANGRPDGSRTTAFEITREKKVEWSYASTDDRNMMTAFRINPWQWPLGWESVTPKQEETIRANAKALSLVPANKPRRVLVLSRAYTFSHHDALSHGDRALAIVGKVSGAFSVDCTADPDVLCDSSRLAVYDAVVINNSTGLTVRRHSGLDKALVEYVKGGKGLCLIHSALDSFYDSPALQDLGGGCFIGHPWHAGGNWLFRNEEPDHPLMAMFKGATFVSSDEIYMHSSPAYSRDKDRVLVSIDLSDSATKNAANGWLKHGKLRDDNDYAVSWTRHYGAGRVFYTSFGHDKRAFLDPVRLAHVVAGLQYCIGDLACEDSPRK